MFDNIKFAGQKYQCQSAYFDKGFTLFLNSILKVAHKKTNAEKYQNHPILSKYSELFNKQFFDAIVKLVVESSKNPASAEQFLENLGQEIGFGISQLSNIKFYQKAKTDALIQKIEELVTNYEKDKHGLNSKKLLELLLPEKQLKRLQSIEEKRKYKAKSLLSELLTLKSKSQKKTASQHKNMEEKFVRNRLLSSLNNAPTLSKDNQQKPKQPLTLKKK